MNSARKSVLAAGLALLGVAHAGHEFPFYPSFYPQEITVEALDARSAAERLAKGTLHAYAGGEIAAPADGTKSGTVTSLGGYVVATFEGGGCADARGLKDALGEGQVWHPYPVTPFHADYLHHADRAEAARAGAVADKREKKARIEIVEVSALMAKAGARYNGWSGPPWVRQGWFHAYLLLTPPVSDAAIEETLRRLVRGEHRSLEERVNLERKLVALLQRGCERVVLGYTERRERYGVDYSQGVENVGYGALEGLASPIFPRTVKLRDFPWNGWLNVAAPAPPSSAWNPIVGGFGDAFGRVVWSALSDPAFLPAPHGGGWIENRVSASVEESPKPIAVPEDALFTAGRGKMAASRIVYRVRNSAFHDGTPMSVADLLYGYAFAAAWATDPGIAQATALARERLKGVRPLRVETETLAFGEDKLSYEVPVIEVYLDAGPGADAATVAPPWSTLPWHLLALLEEGARRGYFKLSEVDPVRNVAIVQRLGMLARELEERAYVPPALISHVNAKEARERYRRLREFHAAHGHWLVTNGPYRLSRWDGTKAVLGAFRDPSYPKGLGGFNAYAVPLKAHVTRIDQRAYGAEVHTETEWLERLGREVRIARGSFAQRLAERLTSAGALPAPVCHYLLVGPDGAVAAAGAVRAGGKGACRLEFTRTEGRPGTRLVVAAVLEDSAANAPIRIVPWGD
ncbi:MAG TPA: hypothetical protein VML57_13045 [Burkholderiales bacterium]|nr:hypothetical protein [Burkholderiales bacterium]